ncbi:hypothetical protein E6C27_scaffold1220G00170 [Cucumis melo var. makuwa]|uniref:Mucin-19-like n=1 Tax=Cucumis melo var. makuwa TaxID=1194695 RepID=A0A5A7SL00_CUCMM|nr:hypothetical protein E6C27_scaffold1220G00170 [Cucumis melo var. makuwa]
MLSLDEFGVREVTLEFRSFTASAVGANSPMLGWIRLDVDLNENLATFQLERYCDCCRWFSIDCGVTVNFICEVEYLTGMVSFGIPRLICVSFGITRLICASFRITRLICASFGITRLICASFGITRLICASFGITKLIYASFGITRLMCKGMARGRPARGKKDA